MNNGLTDKGISLILDALSPATEEINFSQNNIGHQSISRLVMILRNYEFQLSKLNLDNTKIGVKGAIRLIEALKKLKILDLSNNKLTDECG